MRPPDSPRGATATSWLCRDDADRQRMLEMEERIRPVRRRAALIMTAAILAASPWLGWWPLAFVLSIMAGFATADSLMGSLERPELLMFGAWVASALTIAVAVALSGAHGTAALPLLAIPVLTLTSRFSARGVTVGVLISLTLAFGVGFGIDHATVLANPVLMIILVALILCAAILSTPLMQSDIKHRSDAVIDQLTGMLNRHALDSRVRELTEQAGITGEPIGVPTVSAARSSWCCCPAASCTAPPGGRVPARGDRQWPARPRRVGQHQPGRVRVDARRAVRLPGCVRGPTRLSMRQSTAGATACASPKMPAWPFRPSGHGAGPGR
jgi:hypothetical protein